MLTWRLSQRWVGSKLCVLDDAGHGGDSLVPAIVEALKSTETLASS